MFHALVKRRNVRLRYERFSDAQTAAAVYNVNRGSADDAVITAFDFVRDAASTRKRERLIEARRYVRKSLVVPSGTPIEKIQEIRQRVIADLTANNYPDAEAIVAGCFNRKQRKRVSILAK